MVKPRECGHRFVLARCPECRRWLRETKWEKDGACLVAATYHEFWRIVKCSYTPAEVRRIATISAPLYNRYSRETDATDGTGNVG